MKYDPERAAVTLSVTELCAEALTRGDLDLRMGGRQMPERARIGAEIHRKLQAEAGAAYQPEVSMTNTTLFHNLSFEVSGRADGLFFHDEWTVDEIKTVSAKAFSLPPEPMHGAQVKCYAYFLCREKELDAVNTRLTYYCLDDGKTRYLTERHTKEDLQRFYFGLLAAIEYRARILVERETVLRPSVHSGRFPYSHVREGQDIMLKECYRDIRAGKRLFIQAPTGTGKTVSALYPAVRALGEGSCDKIFYLTAKASTRTEALRAASDVFKAGSHLRTVVLSAREQVCKNELAKKDPVGISGHCNPVDCPYAKGFYDRLGQAVCDLLAAHSGYPRRTVEEYAEKHGICPYEFQLELSEFSDIVICDYNYVFDPQIYLRRYFAEDAPMNERFVFLIDEAHNLGDRAAAMFSVDLCNAEVGNCYRALPEDEEALRRTLEKVGINMQGFRRLCADTVTKDEEGIEHGYDLSRAPMTEFHTLIANTRRTLEQWARAHRNHEAVTAVSLLASSFKRFELISEYYDERFLTFIELHGDEITVRLICLDPSELLHERMNRAFASVLFSATLTPPDYFADILGGGKGSVRVSLPSPFDPRHSLVAVVPTVSTRYEDREKSYRKLASLIAAAVSAKAGNYIVYFPSYDYMTEVQKKFSEKYPRVSLVVQSRGMSLPERERFLDAFLGDGKLRVGFCVLGGSFSEGVDLPGKRLIGTVIVGTGLPGISNERNILKEYYDVTRESGFDYAYTYPGMNRVLQAAGRVIRREDDRGVIVLIDDRYATDRYKMLFPEHWQNVQYASDPAELAELTADFWENAEKT